MSEYDRGRKQFTLGLGLVAIITPLAAIIMAIAAAVGALLAVEGRKRMAAAPNPNTPTTAQSPPRLATQRPLSRGENRGPRRNHGSRRPGGIAHIRHTRS
ncbi:hypothetical protein AB0N05_07275 [Nocardia sp. NPDC051030]|uniref:hypothetical protein n=1 Tax=Nocardia sp. NPDC051030 TaxID=3155162 RepID=UPI00341522B2